MHELAICQHIVKAVVEEYGRIEPSPIRLRRACIVAGGLHQIIPDYLHNAYEILTKDTVVEGSDMALEVRPVTGRCRGCAWEGEVSVPFFVCGACNEPGVEVLTGKELYLAKLEIEES